MAPKILKHACHFIEHGLPSTFADGSAEVLILLEPLPLDRRQPFPHLCHQFGVNGRDAEAYRCLDVVALLLAAIRFQLRGGATINRSIRPTNSSCERRRPTYVRHPDFNGQENPLRRLPVPLATSSNQSPAP